jgi:hypothetical protein
MSEDAQNVRIPVYIALIIIGVLTASITFLLRWPPPKKPEIVLTASRPAFVRGRDQPNTGVHPRAEWAASWERQMKAKGWKLRVKTSGEEHRTMELHWGRDRSKQDEVHMKQLQTAEGFFRMLRDRLFDRLTLFVERRRVFDKRL